MRQSALFLVGVAFSATSCSWHNEDHIRPPQPSCRSCFDGLPLVLTEIPNSSPEQRRLERALTFTDKDGLAWKADVGDVTDGASIPGIFLKITGPRFEPDFLPAAVVHDHYTDKRHRVRTWWSTARVFYEAMRVNHTPALKAKLMYYAVYAFGPHWGKVASGTNCGPNCVNLTAEEVTALRAQEPPQFRGVPGVYLYQPPSATDADLAELKELRAELIAAKAKGRPLDEADLEREAARRHPQNAFLNFRG